MLITSLSLPPLNRRPRTACWPWPRPLTWLDPAQCSKWCDAGLQLRDVACHTVNALGWMDPEPVAEGCSERKRPRNSRKCNLGDCTGGFFWRVRPWKPVSRFCAALGLGPSVCVLSVSSAGPPLFVSFPLWPCPPPVDGFLLFPNLLCLSVAPRVCFNFFCPCKRNCLPVLFK